LLSPPHNGKMTQEIVPIQPELLEVANTYLQTGSIVETANALSIPPDRVAGYLEKKEIRSYIDQVFLDQGYRNRSRLAQLLDKVIDAKVEEAEETEMYSDKDLADLIHMAHKMRMDELKLQQARPGIQINQQINNENPFGQGKYGDLVQKLLECPNE